MDFSNVTAIIKTFKRNLYLENCLSSLRQSYPTIKIIVVDDSYDPSDPQPSGHLAQRYGARFIPIDKDAGLCAGRNRGLAEVQTDYVLIGDDDFTYRKTCLEPLLKMMDIADIAGGAVSLNGKIQHYEAMFWEDTRMVMHYLPLGLQILDYQGVKYQPAHLVLNFFIGRTDIVRQVEWDPSIKIMFEHEDFFLRASELGVKAVYCPDSWVVHKGLEIEDSKEYIQKRWDLRGKLRFFEKWGFSMIVDQNGLKMLADSSSQFNNAEVILVPIAECVPQDVWPDWVRAKASGLLHPAADGSHSVDGRSR